jgi:large subunit ribosomal protein L27
MAHRKAGGTAKNLRDSNPKFLGVKIGDGQSAKPGAIIVRQRGTKIKAGKNVKMGVDHTLYASAPGTVKFRMRRSIKFTGATSRQRIVDVLS